MSVGWENRAPLGTITRLVVSTTGDADLVAAIPGKEIRVLALQLRFSAAGTITFKSGSTTIGVVQAEAAGTIVLPEGTAGWFKTVVGEKLASSSGGLTVSGTITYVEL